MKEAQEENAQLKSENDLLQTRLRSMRKSVVVDGEEAAQLQANLRGLRKSISEAPDAAQVAALQEKVKSLESDNDLLQTRLRSMRKLVVVNGEEAAQLQA